MTHQLKIWPGNYAAVASGDKTHEIRDCTDRKFSVGDSIVFREWKPDVVERGPTGEGVYTDSPPIFRRITYVSVPGSWGLPDNLCVFSIK